MELDPAKSVFISYRRQISWQAARLVYRALKEDCGYDVFMDVESLDSGEFGTIIMHQIAARGHFVVILVPGSLDRCDEPNDWLRREIEQAIDLGRNIVPVLFDGFDFTDAKPHLTGKLAKLSGYNAVIVPPDYFDAAMERLHDFLSRAPQGEIQPAPPQDAPIVARKQQEAQTATADADDSERLLSAEEYFNLGKARADQGDLAGAIEDYNQALRLDPNDAVAYYNRGIARRKQGDLAGAIKDYTQALRLAPNYAAAYNNCGLARRKQGDLAGAIADYERYLEVGGGPNTRNAERLIRELRKQLKD